MSGTDARPRGRPRHFDEETVLDELTALFWSKGYAKTSITDLVETAGVHRPSLYRTFGTKEELFARVLRRYFAVRMEGFAAVVHSAGPGIEGIHTFLELLREDVVSGGSQQGCLLVNTSTELCGTAPGFEDFGVEYRNALKRRLRPLISQAEPETTGDNQVTGQRTDLFVTFLLGLNVTVRGGANPTEIGHVVDAMHATVDTWQT